MSFSDEQEIAKNIVAIARKIAEKESVRISVSGNNLLLKQGQQTISLSLYGNTATQNSTAFGR